MIIYSYNIILASYDCNYMPCQSGTTPLHYAASDASVEVVQFLLDHGANLHATNQVSIRVLVSLT